MQNTLNGLIDNLKMMYFMNARENNYYENIFIMFIIFLISFTINNDTFYIIFEKGVERFCDYFRFLYPKSNTVILEGKRCMKVTNYITKTDNLFSNRFNAFWYYISKNNLTNNSIYCLKEYANSSNIYDDFGEPKSRRRNNNWRNEINEEDSDNETEISNKDIYIVDQSSPFKITKDIYCKVNKNFDKSDEKKTYEMENISIEIYSYKLSLKEIEEFIDKIDNNFQKSIEKNRKNKKFIYTLTGTNDNNHNNYDNHIKNIWEECEFKSNRNFNNLFFDKKKHLINKLNFFIKNKEWYDYEGHPYTFGIGLHGPPGTGKTSVIKCIANKLNRNIIVIPLSKIKTQKDFSEYFFEQYYTRNNRNKIDFDEKIIVFEDIDCMDDIVKNRKNKKNKKNKKSSLNDSDSGEIFEYKDYEEKNEKQEKMSEEMKTQTLLLNKIAKKVDDDHIESVMIDIDKSKDDKITLSFILNIIDGIRETPGRILIITSNDYGSLDPALVRPGRIDLTLEMNNASVDVIKEMYNHYYNKIIPDEYEKKLKDYKISPAKIVNLRLENEKDDDFLIALEKEM